MRACRGPPPLSRPSPPATTTSAKPSLEVYNQNKKKYGCNNGIPRNKTYLESSSRIIALKKHWKNVRNDDRHLPISSPNTFKTIYHDQSKGLVLTQKWI